MMCATEDRPAMCFSATANFVGSGVLGAIGVVTLTNVMHQRELLLAALPIAIRRSSVYGGIRLARTGWDRFPLQWRMTWARRPYALRMDFSHFCCRLACSCSSPIQRAETDAAVPRTWRSDYALYFVGADGIPVQLYVRGNSIVYINQAANNIAVALVYAIATCGSLFFKDQNDGNLRRGKPGDTAGCNRGQAIRVHVVMVCVGANMLVKGRLRPAAANAGVLTEDDQRRFGCHNLRRSLASFLVRSKTDPKTVQALLRHSDVNTPLQLYAHSVSEDPLAAQGQVLHAILQSGSAVVN